MPLLNPPRRPSGEFGQDFLRIDPAGQGMGVVAIAGDHLVARLHGHLHAGDHRFLADIQVAIAANQPHSVKLSDFFLKAADQ